MILNYSPIQAEENEVRIVRLLQGGGLKFTCVYVYSMQLVPKMSMFVPLGYAGGQRGQNIVHVVIE